jgi:Ser/Thr protein kinase RdoA (MazF antagonist)
MAKADLGAELTFERRAGPDADPRAGRGRARGAGPAPRAVVRYTRPSMPPPGAAPFLALTPDRVLDAVEVGGLRTTGRCLPLRAFENRVYEVELTDERRLVVKFYRPGRWARETILDEHRFLADLAEAELPVVAPLDLGTGTTLNERDGIFYAAFPRVRGRTLDELDAEQRRHIGRTIGRMHAVGAARPAPHRPRLTVERYVHEPLEVLLGGGFIPEPLGPRYRALALRVAEVAAPRLAAVPPQRIHGDLHHGNLLWTPDPVLVDFDDCLMGPPVQDLWLLARGEDEDARRAREELLEGYEVFRAFDRSTLALVEPLRAMRIVYMSGWIARRWEDPSFPQAFPGFRDARYWMHEHEVLATIAEGLG